MSLLLAAALAAAPATLPACSWDRPGANPFTGDVVEAVQRYTDIPEPVRKVLQTRMAARQYDEIATISRNAITGKARYRPEIRDMHFGAGTVCRTVTRKKWPEKTVERGLVYCESGHCLIVPTVCRNVSRITRLLPERAAADAGDLASPRVAGAGGALGDSSGRASAKSAGDSELQFDSPGAGASFAQRATANAPADAVALLTPGGGGSSSSTPDRLGNPPPGAGPGSGTGATADAGGNPPGAPPFGGGGAGGTGGGSPPQPISTGGGGLGGGGLTGVDRPIDTVTSPVTVVPEPGTWALMSLGALFVLGAARRRRKG